MTRIAVGFLMLVGAAIIGVQLSYIQWFVHPEYTKQMMFWTYWPESLMAAGLGMGGVWSIESGCKR